jgi:hypothetical protein
MAERISWVEESQLLRYVDGRGDWQRPDRDAESQSMLSDAAIVTEEHAHGGSLARISLPSRTDIPRRERTLSVQEYAEAEDW